MTRASRYIAGFLALAAGGAGLSFADQPAFPQTEVPPADEALASVDPAVLAPFVASYQAYNGGNLAGNAVMRLVKRSNELWRIDLDVKADSGLAGLAGLTIQQSTAFRSPDGLSYQPLAQSTVQSAVFKKKQATGIYDWKAHLARWQGDVKDKRKAPVPLQDGDLSTLLLNLAVIRDAEPGKQLSYRLVDDGKARQHAYEVSGHNEIIQIGELSYEAMRVSRTNGGNDETVMWVANGVPTPVRILQRENGKDTLDLRLVQYQGVSPQ